MSEWSEDDANNVDVFNEGDNLAAMNENNQEDHDNDLSHNISDHISPYPQNCVKEERTINKDLHKLEYISQVGNTKNVKLHYKGMKIQCFQEGHHKVYFISTTHSSR